MALYQDAVEYKLEENTDDIPLVYSPPENTHYQPDVYILISPSQAEVMTKNNFLQNYLYPLK